MSSKKIKVEKAKSLRQPVLGHFWVFLTSCEVEKIKNVLQKQVERTQNLLKLVALTFKLSQLNFFFSVEESNILSKHII